MYPGNYQNCYKRVEIREVYDSDGIDSNDEIIEEIEQSYVANYVEHYNLIGSENFGLVPFEIIIKERIIVDEESSANTTPQVNNNDSNTQINNTDPAKVEEATPNPNSDEKVKFALPMAEKGLIVTSDFGKRSSGEHKGIDMVNTENKFILGSADGTVLIAEVVVNYGNVVYINHKFDGVRYQTRYAHMKSISVKKDTTVKAGEVLGIMGTTGQSTGEHLHFEIRRINDNSDAKANTSSKPENPRDYIPKIPPKRT